MKKYLFIIAAAATFMLVACSKENELRTPEENVSEENVHLPGWTYITANMEGDNDSIEGSKVRIDGSTAAFQWSTGCQIAVYSGGTYHVSAANHPVAASVEFAFEGSINADRADFAVYPAALVHDGTLVRESSAINHTAEHLTITLPSTYTYAEVSGNQSPTPMIAVNAPNGALEFKSICALLRIAVRYIPKDAAILKITFPGKKVNGEFTLSNFTAGTDGLVVAASSADGDDTITITDLDFTGFDANMSINIPVPIGYVSTSDYPYVRVAAYDYFDNGTQTYSHKINSIDTPIVTVDSAPKVWNPNRLTSRLVTAKLPYFLSNNQSKKKIVFAPGNLQATTTAIPATRQASDSQVYKELGAIDPNSWRFAAHQWEAYGETDSNDLKTPGDIDLFAWVGTSATYADFTNSNKYGIVLADVYHKQALCGNISASELINPNNDWSNIFNGVTYPANTWRLPNDNGKALNLDQEDGGDWTLDKNGNRSFTSEMARLLGQKSTTYTAAKATIKDGETVKAVGLIAFPDTYTHPYGFKALINYGRSTVASSHFAGNELTLEEWDVLEKVGGCVFLPVTCIRDRVKIVENEVTTYVTGTSIYKEGAYWSNYTVSGSNVATAIICDADYCAHSRDGSDVTNQPKGPKTNVNASKSVDRSRGCGVRLIRDVN